MKKLFLFILSIFIIQNINATHNIGGEITLKQLAYKQYEVNLITYTVASSLPADRDSLFLCWGDGLCEWIPRETSNLIDCGLKQNIYKKTHTYSSEGSFIVSMTDPNRNGGIINLNAPISDNTPFHVQTRHTVSSDWNQTPILLNIPNDIGIMGSVYQHNAAAVDLDGDSLSYSLIVPMSGVNENVPNYLFPNEVSPNSNNNISIDEERGTITWDAPQLAGPYTIAILIKEYRGGQLISETIRDFLVRIGSGPSVDIPPVTSIPFDEVTLSVGEEFNFEVTCDDINGANISVQAFGLPFLISDTAQFSPDATYLPPVINGNFSWTISDANVYLRPFYVVFRTEQDDGNPLDECGKTSYQVLKININDSPTSINNIENFEFKIFPNPLVQQQIHLEVPIELISKKCNYKIINLQSKTLKEGILASGNQYQTIDIQEFSKGTYFIVLQSDHKTSVQKFVKMK